MWLCITCLESECRQLCFLKSFFFFCLDTIKYVFCTFLLILLSVCLGASLACLSIRQYHFMSASATLWIRLHVAKRYCTVGLRHTRSGEFPFMSVSKLPSMQQYRAVLKITPIVSSFQSFMETFVLHGERVCVCTSRAHWLC